MLDSTIELSGRRLTIIGNGWEQTIISGSQKCRVFLFVEACVIDMRSLGYNLVRSDPGGYFRQRTTDLEGVNPRLRKPAESDNTFYHPLFEDSPAIDAGDPDVRTADQLGRPVNGRRDLCHLRGQPLHQLGG